LPAERKTIRRQMLGSLKITANRALGAVLCLGALAVFGCNAHAATAGGPPTTLDQAVAAWLDGHRAAGLTAGMRLLTGLASTPWVSGLTLIFALGLAWKHAWQRLFVFALIVPGGMAVSVLLKQVFHRPRPVVADALSAVAGYSFPSGHTLAATLLYGGMVCVMWNLIEAKSRRLKALAGAFVLVALVGLSRVQLGAHYLSDVLGGFTFGVAWLLGCLTARGVGFCPMARERPRA
jgi:membrane-associated phospholipid phosphatase